MRKVFSCVIALILLLSALPLVSLSALAAKYDMPYYIEIDIKNCITTVYRTSDDAVMIQAICTPGTDEFYTPSGTFYLPKVEDPTERTEWFYFRMYGSWAKYATRIFRGILFHSLIFDHQYAEQPTPNSIKELGTKASHGCVRLRVEDAKWISENCLEGTRVHIFRNGKLDEELRELLLSESYHAESGMTYQQYMGMAEDENSLGRYSEGSDVLDLQYRLQSLGYFNGTLNGKYASSTVKAVRAFQRAEGLKDNGVVNPDVSRRIFASDAAVGTLVPLTFSMNGPAVTQIQQALTDIQLYSGDIDSVYDGEVQESVHSFQGAFGFDYDDTCQPEVQDAMLNVAKQVKEVFGGKSYSSEITSTDYEAARISINDSVRLRREANTYSGYYERLQPGDRMLVAERLDNAWSHVRTGTNEGYISDKFLEFYEYTNMRITYISDDGSITFTLGQTPEEYLLGDVDAASEAALRMADHTYVKVSTGDPEIMLNMREEADKESAVAAKLPDGLELEAIEVTDTWTKAEYNGTTGYLLNRYLTFETRQELERLLPENDYEEDLFAKVTTTQEGGYLGMRAIDSPDSSVVAQLQDGTVVQVLSMDDNWAYIQTQKGEKGYVLNRYLLVIREEAEEEEASE